MGEGVCFRERREGTPRPALFFADGFLTFSSQLSCLEEKPTSAKLNMLYRKSLYVLALNMAKSQLLDESSVADIHRQYGDHLYMKGDYDGTMAQFVKTTGYTQPSYIIRKVTAVFYDMIHVIILTLFCAVLGCTTHT